MTALNRPDFPKDPTKANLNSNAPVEWIGTISPLRSDLEGSQALVLALKAIQQARVDHGIRANSELARSHLKHALSLAPYDAELWLASAVLEARQDPDGPAAIESLKMSYLTAPNDARLMPLRLATVTQFDALASPDLRDLAQGDVRLMLTRQPDQAPALVSAYRQASGRGKEFLEGAIRTIDPARLRTLSG
ncbi:hypothetical protein I3J27_07685 [Bradyrhizobium xenonodulans]|uniref:Uncharacterized protein n=1 Tax=Bradyrhizobium xenonodulans TaxID=2736875 RepID=A0ABY7MQ49_9BRAD|nr:hypothetical protein [Bradyrhizobium xenonodulans]WBL80294.1 hypothetical protein I3J27_07685 [Bradyrhizobium xenonodulans]